MPHVPTVDIRRLGDIRFDTQLEKALAPSPDYDVQQWLFVPNEYTEYRYILGTRGKKPLICIGINPSTARPGDLDPTLKSVERVAKANGFDSFIMFNVYAQRATSPDDMEPECNPELHRENMRAFAYALSLNPRPVVWAAWGTIIEKRPYLDLSGGYDRPGPGIRRPMGHLRPLLQGRASPPPPVSAGRRPGGALRRGGIRPGPAGPGGRRRVRPPQAGMRRGHGKKPA